MKVLITGAAGFIGSHLYDKLKKDGHDVFGIDNFFHPCKNPANKGVQYGDVLFKRLIDERVKDCDIVYHLAAQIHVDKSIENPQETVDINITGTLNVLEAVRKYNKKMVFASTSEVYGTQEYTGLYCSCQNANGITKGDYGEISELHPLNCQSPYAASKVAAERLCYAYWKTYKTKVAILRNFNTFGPYQSDDSYGGVIGIFTRKALSGEPLEVFGDGNQERDYMYITDAIRGYELAVEKELWGKPINLGTGETIKINELAKEIVKLTKSNSEIKHVSSRPGEVQRLCADISFAQELGFEPKTNFKNDLKRYVEHKKNTLL